VNYSSVQYCQINLLNKLHITKMFSNRAKFSLITAKHSSLNHQTNEVSNFVNCQQTENVQMKGLTTLL